MAKVQLHPLLLEVRGRIGDWVFRRVGRDTIVSRRPRRRQRPPTPNQLRQRRHFQDAMAYGRAVARDPQLRRRYVAAARARLTSVYVCALTDFLNPPRITRVDCSRYTGRAGQALAIHAEDNFEVRSVAVRITDATGGEIEAGPAVRDARTGKWSYRARQTVVGGVLRVEIVVTDHPGHTATQSIEIQRRATGGCRRTKSGFGTGRSAPALGIEHGKGAASDGKWPAAPETQPGQSADARWWPAHANTGE